MSDGKKYYCFCSSNCKYETMTKEQILAAIAQAITTGKVGECDTGFVTKVKETNGGGYVTLWVGTQAQYNALDRVENNCLHIITDDTSADDLLATVKQMATAAEESAAAAAEAAEAARAAAGDKLTTIDISDKIALSNDVRYGGKNLTELYIGGKSYVYVPALKMVYFIFDVVFKGTMTKGEQLLFNHVAADSTTSGYKPKLADGMTYPVTSRRSKFSGEYAGSWVMLYAEEAINTGDSKDSMTFCGWYYCEGA